VEFILKKEKRHAPQKKQIVRAAVEYIEVISVLVRRNCIILQLSIVLGIIVQLYDSVLFSRIIFTKNQYLIKTSSLTRAWLRECALYRASYQTVQIVLVN